MKLIIDIPDRIYKINQNRTLNITDAGILEKAVRNSTPLDDVKAEIKKLRSHSARFRTSDGSVVYVDSHNILEVLDNILDNIGKAESEDKE